MLRYLARYTHREAISNSRLVDMDDEKVRFRWKDYADSKKTKTMQLDATEFMRRFLLHVLPKGFMRIRHYGFLANRYRKHKLELCRKLLLVDRERDATADKDTNQLGDNTKEPDHCPVCGEGQMLIVFVFLQSAR